MSRTFTSLTIPAGAIRPLEEAGQCFAVAWSPSIIEIKWHGAGFGMYEQGDGEDLRSEGGFKRLELRNPSASPVEVVMWIGDVPRVSQRVAVMEPPTASKGYATASINANSGIDFSGVASGAQIRRKAVLVTNKDANVNLEIRDLAGLVLTTVFPQQTYTLPISTGVRVYNPNGAAVACNISEIWWTS